jgi:hypothetical protein
MGCSWIGNCSKTKGSSLLMSDWPPCLVSRSRIGARAAMVPTVDVQVHGALMKLPHADIENLYSEPSVRAYRPEPVLAVSP